MERISCCQRQNSSAPAKVTAVDSTRCSIPHPSRAEGVVDRLDARKEAQPQLTTVSERPILPKECKRIRMLTKKCYDFAADCLYVLYGPIVDVEANV